MPTDDGTPESKPIHNADVINEILAGIGLPSIESDAFPDLDTGNIDLAPVVARAPTDKICDQNPLPTEWPDGLSHFKGSAIRLCGIEVYYDFNWKHRFKHNRKTFTDGQTLASFVKSRCPNDKIAALLLTQRADVKPGIRITASHFIAVVHLDTYSTGKTSPATSYFFSNLTTNLELLQTLEESPDLVQRVVSKHLGYEAIQAWINEDPSRLEKLRGIITSNHANSQESRLAFDELIQRWPVGEIPQSQISAIASLVASSSGLEHLVAALADRADELCALPQIAGDDGRRMVAAALRASHRTDAIKLLRQCIADDAAESEFQAVLDANWWMMGTQYVERISKRQLTLEEKFDILLRSADGFFDIIELKRASAPLFVQDHNKWVVSSDVNRAVNQAAHYISEIEASRDSINRRNKIDVYKLHGFVVIGHLAEDASDVAEKRAALRMYNSHLHRIRVIPYDELLRIAEQVVTANTGEIAFAANPAIGTEETRDAASAEPEPPLEYNSSNDLDFDDPKNPF